MWLGEFYPHWAHSTDGVHWSTPYPVENGGRGVAGNNVCVHRDSAQSGRLLMGYHCGNLEESMCVATSAEEEGTRWLPVRGGHRRVHKPTTCLQNQHCCGEACRFHADAPNCLRWSAADCAHWVSRRDSFGTPAAWREIRGVSLAINRQLWTNLTDFSVARKWYLDREGKDERFQRQAYALTVGELPTAARWAGSACGGPPPDSLRLGLLTVLHWPKLHSLHGRKVKEMRYDVTKAYLVTSRDGALFDLSTVYAEQPLAPHPRRKLTTSDGGRAPDAGPWPPSDSKFDNGFILPASELVTTAREHLLYYEARNCYHIQRFRSKARIARASWARDRLGGVLRWPAAECHRAPAPAGVRAGCGAVETRPFTLNAARLALNVRAHADAPVSVELIDDATGEPFAGRSAAECKPIVSDEQRAIVSWLRVGAELGELRGRRIRLRVLLCAEPAPERVMMAAAHSKEPQGQAAAQQRLFAFTLLSR